MRGRTTPGQVRLFGPETDEYARATTPHNSSGAQRPALVAVPTSAQDVAAVVVEAARRGLRVVPQATGHGAGGEVGPEAVVLDTSSLDAVVVDPQAGTAWLGAGLTWGRLNAEAEQHGLLGLAGSAPSVSVSGYTFGGGLGWLTRPHGMASSALRAVEYVTGRGEIRLAAEDAEAAVDRDALWAFRGGGGVGIATRLEVDVVPVPDLHAGYLLWPVDDLDAVVAAWSASLPAVGVDVATSLAVLHAPPAPPFPDVLRGRTLVHLAVAASTGDAGVAPLLDAVRAAATPAVDTWGPADAATLGGIHLDPPGATPALGEARWLTADAPGAAAAVLAVAAADDSPVAMLEIRGVGNDATARPGALTSVPGPFVVHAVGPVPSPDARPAVQESFSRVRAAVADVDAGLTLGSWVEGATSVPDALPADVRERVRAVADAVDPSGVLGRSRFVS